ncbi:MAG: EutN/CcmL family microcompartment protein [Spirochaetota bacterium]
MMIARVTGTVVATAKHPHYEGLKVLVVQPLLPDGTPKGKSLLAVDGAKAGVGDTVLVIDEGGSARTVVGRPAATTIRCVVAGIIDHVDV